MGSWIKKYENQARVDPERCLILLEYITGAMYNASFSLENAQKIFELGLLPSLTHFLDINFIPKRSLQQQNINTSMMNASMTIPPTPTTPTTPLTPNTMTSPSKRRRKQEFQEQEGVYYDGNHISSLLKTSSIEKSDDLIKFRCAGIVANCARLPWTQILIYKSGIVDHISPILGTSSKTDLIVHCLNILGQICSSNLVLDSMFKRGAMKAVWSMLRNEKPEIQAAAARAISNCVHNPQIAGRIGETYVSGIGVLVRVLESSRDIHVLSSICQAIAKMSQHPINRAIFTEEGACVQLAGMLSATQKNFDELLRQLETPPKHGEYSMCLYETESGEKKKLVYDNPDLNKKLDDYLLLRSRAALAIAEVGKHQKNPMAFFERGVTDPLIENIKLQRMLQKHYDSNHKKHYENTAMIEITQPGTKLSSNTPLPSHNASLDASKSAELSTKMSKSTSPFVCYSLVCAPYLKLDSAYSQIESMKEVPPRELDDEKENKEELFEDIPSVCSSSDIDCHYHHIFRNTSYALSVLSENEVVSKTLRIRNAVHLLVRLLSAKNDALQLSAATAIANVRKFHVCSKSVTVPVDNF